MPTTEDVVQVRDRHTTNLPKGLIVWSAVLLVCVLILIVLIVAPRPQPPSLPAPPVPEIILPLPNSLFFDKQVQPEIQIVDKLNRQAAERCLKRLSDTFAKYREGIDPFTDDLMSFRTRFGVLRRIPTDWWYEETEGKKYIEEKFEEHFFSEQGLNQDIQLALDAFRKEIKANDTTLLTNIRAAVSRSDLPTIKIEYKEFSSDVVKSLQAFANSVAVDSLLRSILTEITSGIGGAATSKIVTTIATRILTMTATTAAAAGGSTAASTTVGAAGGTTGGPVVAAVGAGAGFVVGIAIDWWMSARFKAQLDSQLNDMFDQLESSVIHGDSQQPGLQKVLAETCDAIRDAYRTSLYKRIVVEGEAKK